MAVEVLMPKIGLNMREGLLVEWLANSGDRVAHGQPLFIVETDKVTNEILAETSGILHTMIAAGTMAPVAGVVGFILAQGEQPPSAGHVQTSGPIRMEPETIGEPAPTASVRDTIVASPAARRRAKELGVDLAQVIGSRAGGKISEEDVEIFAARRKGQTQSHEISATPVARRMAKELGLDLAEISPANGKQITREDVEHIKNAQEVVSPKNEAGETTPFTGIRAVIAQRMHTSTQQTAPVTLMSEVNATPLVRFRSMLFERGLKISYNDVLMRLAALCLVETPAINASLEVNIIRIHPEVNIGLAVDTPRGLLVPVLRNANRKTLLEVCREMADLVQRAQDGLSTADDLTGGTFTITNLGMYGIDAFTPIIDLPEVAILGVGRIIEKPVAEDGKIFVQNRLVLSLTFDHRLVDGAPAARFLQGFSAKLEAVEQILASEV